MSLVFINNQSTDQHYTFMGLLPGSLQAYLALLCFALLHFTDMMLLEIEDLWQPCVDQVYWCHFSKRTCSLHVSMSYFSNSCNISNCSIIITFVIMICELWCYYCNYYRVHEPYPHKTANLLINVCVFWRLYQPTSCSPISLPLLGPPIPLDTTILKVGQLIIQQWTLRVQVKGRGTCLSL